MFVLLLLLSSMSLLFLLPSVLMGCALMHVDDEAHCLSSRFWFAMLEGSLGLCALCVGIVFFSLGINACYDIDCDGCLFRSFMILCFAMRVFNICWSCGDCVCSGCHVSERFRFAIVKS